MSLQGTVRPYLGPLLLNGLLVLGVALAFFAAYRHRHDGALGGVEYALYGAVSILLSGPVNLLFMGVAYYRGRRAAVIGYGIGAVVFFGATLWIHNQLNHTAFKPGS